MILHLIRHGKTLANEQKLYYGFTDISVSQQGLQELAILKKDITYPVADLHIVSGLMRTVQTANILFDSPSLEIITDLREMNFGDFEMRSYEELKSVPAYQDWISNIAKAAPPRGERQDTFLKRITRGLLEIEHLCKSKSASSAVIITHGGVIATIMALYFPGHKNFYQWQPEFGRGYTLHLDANKNYTDI